MDGASDPQNVMVTVALPETVVPAMAAVIWADPGMPAVSSPEEETLAERGVSLLQVTVEVISPPVQPFAIGVIV